MNRKVILINNAPRPKTSFNHQLAGELIFTTNKLEEDILRTKLMLRLHHIKQLGLAYLVYSGANTSRFDHSLGVCYFGTKMFDSVIENYKNSISPDAKEIIDFYRQKLRLKLLLHDVFHGPYSHQFERAVELAGHKYDHEEQALYDSNEEINIVFKRYGFKMNAFNNLELERIIQLIKDSSLDADKMHYLASDAHVTGVNVSIDRNYLISRLRLVRNPITDKIHWGIEDGANHAFEQFILARRRLFDCLYYHEKVKMLENHMEQYLSKKINSENIDIYSRFTDDQVFVEMLGDVQNNYNALAVVYNQPFLNVLKVGPTETERLASNPYALDVFSRELGDENVINLHYRTKLHSFDKDPIYVVDSRTGKETPVLESNKLLRSLSQYEYFWSIYVHPDKRDRALEIAKAIEFR